MQIGFVVSATQYSKQRVVFIFPVPVKKAELIELKKAFNVEQKRGKLGERREQYTEEKSYTVVEMWNCERCNFYKTEGSVKEHLRQSFPNKRPMRQDQFLDNIMSFSSSSWVQCGVKVPHYLREQFAQFPPTFKHSNVCRQYKGPFLQKYFEKEELMSQPQRTLLLSNIEVTNGTIITPLLILYIKKFVQSAGKAHR